MSCSCPVIFNSIDELTHVCCDWQRHVVDGRGEPSGGGPVMVLVDSLASATTEHKLRLLAKNIGPVQVSRLL